MKLDSYTMSCVFSYDRVSSCFRVCRYCISYISKLISWFDLWYPYIESLFCCIYEFLCFFWDYSDGEHTRRITKISIDYCCDIDIEYIPFFQYFICSRNPMTDDIIDRYACTARIASLSPFIISLIVYTCGGSSSREYKSIHDIIEIERRDSYFYILSYHIERHGSEFARFSDSFDLLGSFDENFWHSIIVFEL